MDKVYLALEMVGQTAEKSKLEHDCREGASELKAMEVRITHTHTHTLTNTCPAEVSTVSCHGLLLTLQPQCIQCILTACVFLQQKCKELEQRKIQLTEQCKDLLNRAKLICRMQADNSLPEDLHNVSVYWLLLRRPLWTPSVTDITLRFFFGERRLSACCLTRWTR